MFDLPQDIERITPIILAGGTGSRLHPVSTQNHPKQFLRLSDDKSLFEKTCERFLKRPLLFRRSVVVSNLQYQNFLNVDKAQCRQVILEPIAKNTAAACAIGCLSVMEKSEDRWICIAPSDHIITDEAQFFDDIITLQQNLGDTQIGFFGIKPTSSATGFGYIKTNSSSFADGLHHINAFIEKPDKETIQKLLGEENIYWNSGLILAKARVFWAHLSKAAPELTQQIKEIWSQRDEIQENEFALNRKAYQEITGQQIDTVLLENCTQLYLKPARFDWKDLGQPDVTLSYLSQAQRESLANRTPSADPIIGNP